MPRTEPTLESRCKAAEIRTQRLAQDVQRLERELKAAQDRLGDVDRTVDAVAKPAKRDTRSQREKNDAAALTQMFAQSAGVTELAACHITDLSRQLTILGGDPTPATAFSDTLPPADGSPTATAARRFIAERTEQAKPKRRTRKPKETSHANSI